MKSRTPLNIAASVRQRLLNLAHQRGEDFQFVLTRFASERLLYRLSISPVANDFLLKGAMLFPVWDSQVHRPTLDIDLAGRGESSLEYLKQLFQSLCVIGAADEGLTFVPSSVQVESMRDLQRHPGARVHLTAFLAAARIPLQVDIGYGDVVVPAPVIADYPPLLDHPAPRLRIYPMETVVAEKSQAMTFLGMANTRMKDFYDLWVLARQFDFKGADLSRAIKATFDRRQTQLPVELPFALRPEFYEDSGKTKAWNAFLKKSRLVAEGIALSEVCLFLADFLMQPCRAAAENTAFNAIWRSPGPWR